MKATLLVGVGMMSVACATAHAQVVTAPVEPAAAVPQNAAPAAPQPAARPASDTRREDIRVMELALTQALQKGAQDLARQLRVSEPGSMFVTGNGRARGFVLEGYGMFFDVDVPGMKQSVVWSAQMVQLMQDRERFAQVVGNTRPDDPIHRIAEQQLRATDRLIAAAQGGAVLIPSPNANTQMPAPDRISAATLAVSDSSITPVAGMPAASATGAAAPVPAPEIRDPNELYTNAVKDALIDTMLRLSPVLKIAEGEWLTVAASDSDGPQVPGQLDDASRIVIRVKGSDLAAFHAGKLTREEILKKVEVREF